MHTQAHQRSFPFCFHRRGVCLEAVRPPRFSLALSFPGTSDVPGCCSRGTLLMGRGVTRPPGPPSPCLHGVTSTDPSGPPHAP